MAMIQGMVNQNPQMASAFQMARQMAQNPNKEQVIQQLAQQKGVSVEEIKKQARMFGINI